MLQSPNLLAVPYFAQVSSVQCQSTVLKMYAQYLDKKAGMSIAGGYEVQDIFDQINKPHGNPDKRPSKLKNAHANMMWWLEQNYGMTFSRQVTRDAATAWGMVKQSINRGYPIIASVSHARVEGHINLIVGYVREERADMCYDASLLTVVVHDPYGAFHASLHSDLHGKRRFETGMSLVGGGEYGPGKNLHIQLRNVNRQRASDDPGRRGNFEFMFPL